jgi:hypothetical protein
MKRITLITVAFVVAWLSVTQAQVMAESRAPEDGAYKNGPRDGNASYKRSQMREINLYTEEQTAGESKRFLEHYKNRKNLDSNRQNEYQFNPYQIRW